MIIAWLKVGRTERRIFRVLPRETQDVLWDRRFLVPHGRRGEGKAARQDFAGVKMKGWLIFWNTGSFSQAAQWRASAGQSARA